jgi:hypothetical protein
MFPLENSVFQPWLDAARIPQHILFVYYVGFGDEVKVWMARGERCLGVRRLHDGMRSGRNWPGQEDFAGHRDAMRACRRRREGREGERGRGSKVGVLKGSVGSEDGKLKEKNMDVESVSAVIGQEPIVFSV